MISAVLCGRGAVSAARLHAPPLVAQASFSSRQQGNGILVLRVDSTQTRTVSAEIIRRYASSSSKHKRPPTAAQPATRSASPSTSSTAASPLPADAVNPPPSTLPADLDIPPPAAPNASAAVRLKRYVAVGRAYLSFYKTGLKNVYNNYRASLPLRRSLGLPTYLPSSVPPAKPSSSKTTGSGTAFDTAIDTLNLTRADFQLIRRAAYDMRRLIPFALILLICGEMTPLVVLALGNAITPYTCRVPKQISKDRLSRAERRHAALAAHQAALGSVTPIPPGSDTEMDLLAGQYADINLVRSSSPGSLSAEQVLRACAVFGLARSHLQPSFLVPLLYRPRLRRWAEYLDLDDRLIVRGGGVGAMSADEVRIAVDERGGVGVAAGMGDGWGAEREERRWLERWLARRGFTTIAKKNK
ncbi:hypothetical protein VTN00DRAFT_7409 [Thermoascus crustaceus]|uniref:uncharacterized protein n=1 Tax=Thermoascus crustaceus TaxID=5088 RepID=UPI003743F757